MEDENNNLEAQPEAGDIAAADSGEAGSSSEQAKDLSLELLNQSLGKNFKDIDSALKSLKDTQSYVGKQQNLNKALETQLEEVKGATDPEVLQELKVVKDELFYSKNPQYEGYRDIINSLGNNPAEVVNSETFKVMFDKAQGFDQMQAQRSVLETNPKLGAVSDKMNEARESVKEANTHAMQGDITGYNHAHSHAKAQAVKAVQEAYDIK